MVNEKVAQKVMEFIVRHNIEFAQASFREWGSYELRVRLRHKPENALICRVFGSAYTPEQALGTFIVDLAKGDVPYEQLLAFRDYLGSTIMDELIFMVKLFDEPEKIEAVKEDNVPE